MLHPYKNPSLARTEGIHHVTQLSGDRWPTFNSVHRTLLDPSRIQLSAAFLDDLERVRKGAASRHGALTGFTPDGVPWQQSEDVKPAARQRAPKLHQDDPHVLTWVQVFDQLRELEDNAIKNLEASMSGRRGKKDAKNPLEQPLAAHPLGTWVKEQKGLGLKQVGRLLAAIGDPYWRPELTYYDEDGETVLRVVPEGPRTVSALWAYCGLHVVGVPVLDDNNEPIPDQFEKVAARRRKGVRSNWSTEAKTRTYLCSVSTLKARSKPCTAEDVDGIWTPQHEFGDACKCSPYRVAYDVRRAHTSKSRADWTDGHRHNDALRVAGKEILKALWREARRLHHDADPGLAEQLAGVPGAEGHDWSLGEPADRTPDRERD